MEIRKQKKVIRSFQDLEVYQRLYRNMLVVHKEIVPQLPPEEKYDLKDQLRRCSKSSPALVAEGFAKRYQLKSWKKYLEDAIGECNEIIHHLSVARDVYSRYVSIELCKGLIQSYDTASRQLWRLHESWVDYHKQ